MFLPAFLVASASLAFAAWALYIRMPGRGHRGELPPTTDDELGIAAELERDVRALAQEIGERSSMQAHGRAIQYLQGAFQAEGLSSFLHQFANPVPIGISGIAFDIVFQANVVAEIRGSVRADEIVVVGAHYDSVRGSPGANDNASGVAAMLAIARRLATSKPERTLRFVAFTDEEPPCFQTDDMGSLAYARACREKGERIVAMLSLETLGCYSDAPGSQRYPIPLLKLAYPSRGNFVAFVGNVASRGLVREAIGSFRESAAFPSEGAALPAWIPGVGWSDQWSFWQQGYPAIMVTDTALFRDPNYHRASDTPEKIDYGRLARVVDGLVSVVARLARS